MKPYDMVIILIGLVAFHEWSQAMFYRAYFRRMQAVLGKNPNESLKKEFGWWWMWMR